MATKKKTKKTYDNLVYVVQDYEQHLCGVFTSLQLAAERYELVLTEGLTKEEIQELIDEYGEDYHSELEYPPCIVVYQLDAAYLWSYDSMNEIKQALSQGENYD